MDVVLHLGAHRTATASLHAVVEGNRALLARQGIAVWTPERTRAGLFAGLVRRPEAITEAIERTGQRSAAVIRVERTRLARAGHRHLVVSDPHMIGTLGTNLALGTLYPHLDERLLRFRAAFRPGPRRVVLTIRSYDGYWASALALAVAQGRPLPDAAACDRLVTQPRRWRDVIRDIWRVLPGADIAVVPFERVADAPLTRLSILTDGLSDLAGLPPGADWLNAAPRTDRLRRILVAGGAAEAARRLPRTGGRWTPFDDDQRAALRAQYLEDLTWLRLGAEGRARLVEAAPAPPFPATTGRARLQEDFRTELTTDDRPVASAPGSRTAEAGGHRHGPQGHLG